MISRVPKATQEEMLAAVDSCSRAFHSWSETSILTRQQIFLRYQQLIKDNIVSQRVIKYKVQLKTHQSRLYEIYSLKTKDWLEGRLVFQKELAKAITVEQGKTLADAEGDVFRGLRKFISLTHVHTRTFTKGNK